jgi:hypothetical protein
MESEFADQVAVVTGAARGVEPGKVSMWPSPTSIWRTQFSPSR